MYLTGNLACGFFQPFSYSDLSMEICKHKKGFTLIELLVVIAIIGILAGILLPALSRARESSYRAQCASNLKNIGMGLSIYSNENDEMFPTDTVGLPNPAMLSLNLLYPDYISNKGTFNCISDKNSGSNYFNIVKGVAFTLAQCSYGYDRTHSRISGEFGVAIASDRPPTNPVVNTTVNSPSHGGYGQNVVYVDGHVEFVTTPTAGWYFPDGSRDHIFLNADLTATNTAGGTDTAIIHDG